MLIYIGLGALIAAVALDGIEFISLGAVLGYLLSKLQQTQAQVAELRKGLYQLELMRSKPEPEPEQASGDQEPIDSNDKMSETPQASSSLDKQSISEDPIITKDASPSEPEAIAESKASQTESKATQTQPKVSNKPEDSITTSLLSRTRQWVVDYFSSGNLVVKLGVVILFFGFSFLLKFTLEKVELSMQIRLIAVALFALTMLIVGWLYRHKKQGYGLSLQGLGVGLLYLTLFVSFRIYHLLPASGVLLFLVVFSGLAMALAVIQNSRWLAILSVSGGFLAPVLTSTGGGSHIALFSYYLILNLGIFAVAWKKSWRLLNLVGFVFTFVIGAAWGINNYEMKNFVSTESFLIGFFILYSLISVLFARNQPPKLKGYLDGTLVFGLPIIVMTLQVALVEVYAYGLAWSAFALGAYYFALAYAIKKWQQETMQSLVEAFFALGLIFVSLVIPFVFDSDWTAAGWAVEGAGLIWIGVKQHRWFAKYLGILVQLIGCILFLSGFYIYRDPERFFDSQLMGIIFISLGSIFSAYQFKISNHYHLAVEKYYDRIFVSLGLVCWYFGWVTVITGYFVPAEEIGYLVLLFGFSGLAMFVLERAYQWQEMVHLSWVSLVFFALFTFEELLNRSYLAAWDKWLIWSFYFVCFYGILWWRDNKAVIKNNLGKDLKKPVAEAYQHLLIALLLLLVTGNELEGYLHQAGLYYNVWGVSIFGLFLVAYLYIVNLKNYWPMQRQTKVYASWLNGFFLFLSLIWIFFENFPHSAVANAWIYLPLLNPLDLALLVMLWIAFRAIPHFIQQNPKLDIGRKDLVLGGFVFIWLNIILLRCLHSWAGVIYDIDVWYTSVLVQTSLSIFWTLLALSLTIYASKKLKREIWFAGTGLIGITVVKLFVIDLGNTSSIERIVSFIVVGILLLIMGYFAPLPSKQAAAE